jgi:hypothetical protein
VNCEKGCGAEVVVAEGQQFERSQTDGQYLIIDGRVVTLNGSLITDARRIGLPTYVRHNVKCPNFWRDR